METSEEFSSRITWDFFSHKCGSCSGSNPGWTTSPEITSNRKSGGLTLYEKLRKIREKWEKIRKKWEKLLTSYEKNMRKLS